METPMQAESQPPRGWLRTIVFAVAGAFFLYSYLQTRQLPYLLSAVGFALILPNTFLHPVNWRRPTDTSRHKNTHPAMTLLSLLGAVLIVVGLVMSWT